MRKTINSIYKAVNRCKLYILSIFILYCISCFVGIIMTHNGNEFALSYRDKIVNQALKNDKASKNYQMGNNLAAATNDFIGNLFFGAIPQTLMGIGIVVPYLTVSKQGWIGGIVSVNNKHQSRFTNFKSTFYYFFVIFLQFLPYSIAIGAGIKFGIDFYRQNKMYGWLLWKYEIQKDNLIDLGYIYLLVIPLFFLASCFEFFSTWNA